MVGIFSWHTFGHLVPNELHLNATAYLSIVDDHVQAFMTTVDPSSHGYFQQDNAPCHKVHIISNWFLEDDDELPVLQRPPQSPSQSDRAALGCETGDLHPRWAANKSAEAPDSIMSTCTKLWGMPPTPWCKLQRMKAVLMAKRAQPFTSNVDPLKWLVSQYF